MIFGTTFQAARIMEFPEPYHSLPIGEWRKHMKAQPNSYATIGVRGWLRNRHKCRLVCHDDSVIDVRRAGRGIEKSKRLESAILGLIERLVLGGRPQGWQAAHQKRSKSRPRSQPMPNSSRTLRDRAICIASPS